MGASTVLWGLLFIKNLLSISFSWMVVCAVGVSPLPFAKILIRELCPAIIKSVFSADPHSQIFQIFLNSANLYGYVKCRKDAKAKVQGAVTGFLGKQMWNQVRAKILFNSKFV